MASHSAITNWYQKSEVLNTKVFVDLLDKSMDLIWGRRNLVQPLLKQFFQIETGTHRDFKVSSVSSILDPPVVGEDSDVPRFSIPAPGYDKTFTAVNYYRAIAATDDMKREDRFGKIQGMMTGLPKVALHLHESACANVFNNAFATTLGADGMYLCDTGHPSEDPAQATWANLQTAAAPTHITYSLARVALRNRLDEKGNPMELFPSAVLTTPDREEIFKVIFKSEKESGGNLNNYNWNTEGPPKLIVSSRLTSSTDPWFVFGDMIGEERGMFFYERVAPEVTPLTFTTSYIIWGRSLKMSFDVGFVVSRNIEGNAGA